MFLYFRYFVPHTFNLYSVALAVENREKFTLYVVLYGRCVDVDHGQQDQAGHHRGQGQEEQRSGV